MKFREWLRTREPAALRAAAAIQKDTTGEIYVTLRMTYDAARVIEARECANYAINRILATTVVS